MEVLNIRTKSSSYIPFKYSGQSALVMEQEKEVRVCKVLSGPPRRPKAIKPCVYSCWGR